MTTIEKKPSHPPTAEMVMNAIKEMNDRKGSSLHAIKKFLSVNYDVDADKLSTLIKKFIKSAVVSGKLVQKSGTGAAGSFKLPKKNSVSKSDTKKQKKVRSTAVTKKQNAADTSDAEKSDEVIAKTDVKASTDKDTKLTFPIDTDTTSTSGIKKTYSKNTIQATGKKLISKINPQSNEEQSTSETKPQSEKKKTISKTKKTISKTKTESEEKKIISNIKTESKQKKNISKTKAQSKEKDLNKVGPIKNMKTPKPKSLKSSVNRKGSVVV